MQATHQVTNATRHTLVATDVIKANTLWSRFWGLMGKPGLPKGQGLWIEPCCDIHSCFMRFPFDAVFVDRDHTVLHCIEAMVPWRISRFVRGGRAVLELPAGTIQQSQTQVGDRLMLEPRS